MHSIDHYVVGQMVRAGVSRPCDTVEEMLRTFKTRELDTYILFPLGNVAIDTSTVELEWW